MLAAKIQRHVETLIVLMHMGEVAGRSYSVAGLFWSIRHTAERITGPEGS